MILPAILPAAVWEAQKVTHGCLAMFEEGFCYAKANQKDLGCAQVSRGLGVGRGEAPPLLTFA